VLAPDQRDADASVAGAPGAAGAVDVGLGVFRGLDLLVVLVGLGSGCGWGRFDDDYGLVDAIRSSVVKREGCCCRI